MRTRTPPPTGWRNRTSIRQAAGTIERIRGRPRIATIAVSTNRPRSNRIVPATNGQNAASIPTPSSNTLATLARSAPAAATLATRTAPRPATIRANAGMANANEAITALKKRTFGQSPAIG